MKLQILLQICNTVRYLKSYSQLLRWANDQYTLIEQSLHLKYPNKTFTGALDTSVEQPKYNLLLAHLGYNTGHN